MRHASPWFSMVSVTALAACTLTAAPPPDTSAADAAAIRASSDAFVAAWNAADVAALDPLYADDVVEMPPDQPVHEGRAAIVQSISDYFAEFTSTQSSTVEDVRVEGDLGVSHGTWHVDATPKAGGPELVRNGKWLVVHKRQADGSWKIWRWMWNEESAMAPAGG